MSAIRKVSLSLLDAAFRDRTFSVADSVGLTDSPLRNKVLLLNDSFRVEDLTRTLKSLSVTDALTPAEAALTLSRVIRLSEEISLAEVAFVGEGGVDEAVPHLGRVDTADNWRLRTSRLRLEL